MSDHLRAVVRHGKIELLDDVDLPEGAQLEVTMASNEEGKSWALASESALEKIWGNTEDDVCAQLLQK